MEVEPNWDFMTRQANRMAETRDSIHYLEIGCREGRSLCSVLREPKVSLAVVVDTWGWEAGGSNRGSPDHVIARLGYDDYRRVVFFSGSSHDVLPAIRHTFDMIFVDGDHTQAGCLADLGHVLPLLDTRGSIFIDDLENENHLYLRGAVSNWAALNHLRYTFYQEGCGVAELRR